MTLKHVLSVVLVLVSAVLVPSVRAEGISIDTVLVGDPNNAPLNPAADNRTSGTVAYPFRMGKTEVTVDQFVAFLNAVAATDTNAIYDPIYGASAKGTISRTGSPGSYVYSSKTNLGNKPVNYVSMIDAIRFINWLQNGQPTGAQGPATTEDGAYDLSVLPNSPVRKATALWFLPNQSEWLKAGYYEPLPNNKSIYWTYATRSDGPAIGALATATGDVSNPGANVINFATAAFQGGFAWNGLPKFLSTAGGCGPLSESYYGTRDQDGNVSEWVENTFFATNYLNAYIAGSNYNYSDARRADSFSSTGAAAKENFLGFRVGNLFTGQADLALSITHAGNFAIGAQGIYRVDVTNNSAVPAADGSFVTITLPVELSFVSATGAGWSTSLYGSLISATSTTPVPANGSLPPLIITVAVGGTAAPGSVMTNGNLTNSSPDPVMANNSASNATTLVTDLPPVPAFTTDVSAGTIPFSVHFDASTSSDPDAGDSLTYAWDFGDGSASVSGVTVDHSYTTPGDHLATLSVTDSHNVVSTTTKNIHANRTPTAKAQTVTCLVPGITGICLHGADADGDALTFAVTQQPTHGTLSGTPPLLVYTPSVNATGGDSFAFTTNDGLATSAPATVTLQFNTHSYEVQTWGSNDFGQLGDGSTTLRTKPIKVPALTGAKQVACGSQTTVVLMGDGTVRVWGRGPVGDGTSAGATTPQTLSLTNVVSVAAGDGTFFAVLGDGTVKVWGSNNNNLLGSGAGAPSRFLTPTTIANLNGVVAVNATPYMASALLADGTLMEWGNGANVSGDFSVPKPVQKLNHVAAAFSNVILRDDGTVWTFDQTNNPFQMAGLSGIVAVSGSSEDSHYLALKSDGTVMGWGAAFYGQLGAPTSQQPVPLRTIAGLSGVTAVGGGGSTSIVAFANATVAVFGDGEGGEIGNGSLNQTNTKPTVVKNVAGVYSMAMGTNYAAVVAETSSSPTVYAAASPTEADVNETVAFYASALLPVSGTTITYAWTFGDGTSATGANPTHPYSAPGLYTAIVTGTDSTGQSDTASVTIHVAGAGANGTPTARFTTSSVVGFAGTPLTFDASFSTDPGNNITGYAWDFGDGSPAGSGQVISRMYANAGSYIVSLTVTNGSNLSDTAVRVIEVLDSTQAATFDAQLDLSAKWSIPSTSKDSLTLKGVLNVGDTFVGLNTPVALTIAGTQYTASLTSKLTATTATGSWKFKSNLRGEAFGTVSFTITLKNVNLQSGFEAEGIVPGNDPNATVDADVPVTVSIGGRDISVTLASTFKFSAGKKVKGSGSL